MTSEFLFPMIFSSGVKICDAAFEATAGPRYINITVLCDLDFQHPCTSVLQSPLGQEFPEGLPADQLCRSHFCLVLMAPFELCFIGISDCNPGQCMTPYFPCCPVGLVGPCGSEAYDLGQSLLYILSHVATNWS